MNNVHRVILTYIRTTAPTKPKSKTYQKLMAAADAEAVRMMFSNYRSGNGLRLTTAGLEVMRQFFKGYEVKKPEGEAITPRHLLYLDYNSVMPYYCNTEKFVFFDSNMAVKLKLADCQIDILVEIEGGLR